MKEKIRKILIGLSTPVLIVACTAEPRATTEEDSQSPEPTMAAQSPSSPRQDAPHRRRALLVGIDDYSASRLRAVGPGLPKPVRESWQSLEGAVNDVEAIREVLDVSFGFQREDVLVLTDQDATREAILRSIAEHLVAPAQEGDDVVFYYSGHGSQVRNSESDETDKMDESIVPADGPLGTRDIRDKELRKLFNQILEKRARLVVVLDSCHSGSGARGLPSGARPRRLEPDPRDVADGSDYGPRPEEQGALVLSASQADESAYEVTTEDGRKRGGFTWALLRALRAAADGEAAERVFLRARAWLRSADLYQEPVLAGKKEARQRPLFGGRSDQRDGRTVVLAESVEDDGTVVLRGGWANGLAVGSELSRLPGARETTAEPRLEVTTIQGLGRSTAQIVKDEEASPEEVQPGDLFEIVSWVAPKGSPLRVWIPETETPAAIRQLARSLRGLARQGRFVWVENPLEQRPSHVLRWHGGNGQLLTVENDTLRQLGSSPALEEVVSHLPRDARLFVHLPVPAALARRIEIGSGTRHGAVEPVEVPTAAYHLVGRLGDGTVEYAWVRPATGKGDGGVTGMPSHSAWQPFNEGTTAEETADRLDTVSSQLERHVLRLAKIRAWHQLPSPEGHEFPYRLRFRDEGTNRLVGGEVLLAGREYTVVLELSEEAVPAAGYVPGRYVYVFGIDSAGNSVVLYPPLPWGNEQNHFPLDGETPPEIPLGEDSSFDVVGPYGTDTLFLLTTAEPLLDVMVLEYEGVRGRGPEGSHPLEELLSLTGGSRSFRRSMKTSMKWSIERRVSRTVPAAGS